MLHQTVTLMCSGHISLLNRLSMHGKETVFELNCNFLYVLAYINISRFIFCNKNDKFLTIIQEHCMILAYYFILCTQNFPYKINATISE
jgi:hypothetical protein